MECQRISYKFHALQQMLARNISQREVETVLRAGETIATYPNDKPYPSRLLFGMVSFRPIHVVVAQDELHECYVVTAYEPDPKLWEEDFKTKRRP
jgi:hypothetical protein